MLSLKRFHYFVAVAEELHFGRAADRLGISQPPLSQQIQKLEGELGAQLFDRSRRAVRLTEAGKVLLPEARRLVETSEELAKLIREAAEGKAGTIRLGFTGSVGYRIVPLLLRRFREQYPDARLELAELTSAEQLDRLQNRQLDIGLVRSLTGEEELSSAVVYQEALVIALPADHALASCRQVAIGELRGEPFVLFPRHQGPELHDLIVSACLRHGFSPRVVQEAVQMPTIIGLVGAGFGCSIVPASVQDFHFRGVAYRTIRGDTLRSEILAVWNAAIGSPVRDNFLRIARLSEPPETLATTGGDQV